MKKLILIICLSLLISLATVSAQQGVHEPGTGIVNGTVGPKAKNATGMGPNIVNESNNNSKGKGVKLGLMKQSGNFNGTFQTPSGNTIHVRMTNRGRFGIKSGNVEAKTEMNLTRERQNNKSMLKARLSNGKQARIKVMPDTASQTAIERLRLRVCNKSNNCSIELKEVGKSNETRAAYEVRARKKARLFGIFNTEMEVESQVDAESGEVTRARKPWWAFLASE